LCLAEVDVATAGDRSIEVLCEAPDALRRFGVRCKTAGFVPAPGPAVGATGGGTTCVPSRRALTPKVSRALQRTDDPKIATRTVHLKLNNLALRLLRRQGGVDVCVQVKIRARSGPGFSTSRA